MTTPFDVEALLDSTAAEQAGRENPTDTKPDKDLLDQALLDEYRRKDEEAAHERRGRARYADRYGYETNLNGHEAEKSPRIEKDTAHSGRSSRDREDDRRRDHHRDLDARARGDYYRGSGRNRTRSRSPDRSRHHGYDREGYHRDRNQRDRYDDRSYDERVRQRRIEKNREDDRRARAEIREIKSESRQADSPLKKRTHPRPVESPPKRTPTPEPTEEDRDKRTVFVQQLAARLRTKDLIEFFEKAGPVKEAQIVKDRQSGRSKGVGYVEFKDEKAVHAAIQLTGQKLLGIPIIAQVTEAEKNRQARNPNGSGNSTSVPLHRLYVGNIHFSITEEDLRSVFAPFGELEQVNLQVDPQTGNSKGYGFVQYKEPGPAREALEKMNGFELAGRPIRVGLGNDKFTPESTAILAGRLGSSNSQSFQGSAFSGHGGRGAQAGGSGGNFDRAGGRDNDKTQGRASALDDSDVAGVNFNNYSRDALMRKLARTDEDPAKAKATAPKPKPKKPPVDAPVNSPSIAIHNVFDPNEESEENWVKKIEEEVRTGVETSYGDITHINVDPNSNGIVHVRFASIQDADKAIKGLNGRFFGGRVLTANTVNDAIYRTMFNKVL